VCRRMAAAGLLRRSTTRCRYALKPTVFHTNVYKWLTFLLFCTALQGDFGDLELENLKKTSPKAWRILEDSLAPSSKRAYIFNAKAYALFCISSEPPLHPREVESAAAWMHAMREGRITNKRVPASSLWTKMSIIGFMFFEHDQDIKLMKQACIKKPLKHKDVGLCCNRTHPVHPTPPFTLTWACLGGRYGR
jgi:hypothetical protein